MKQARIVPSHRMQSVKFNAARPVNPVTGADYDGKQVCRILMPHIKDGVLPPYDMTIFFHDGSYDVFTKTEAGITGPDGAPVKLNSEKPYLVVARIEI